MGNSDSVELENSDVTTKYSGVLSTAISYEEVQDMIVSGYTRRYIPYIPKEIKQLITMFTSIRIELQMIFDTESIDQTGLFEIVHHRKIKLTKLGLKEDQDFGATARLLYGISTNPEDYSDITFISWRVKITASTHFPNLFYFIGVIGNDTHGRNVSIDDVDFKKSAFHWKGNKRLKHVYGIAGDTGYTFNSIKNSHYYHSYMKTYMGTFKDPAYVVWKRNSPVLVTYFIKENKLVFEYVNEDNDQKDYELYLPDNTRIDQNYTHWYPCVGLRNDGDECGITDVIAA